MDIQKLNELFELFHNSARGEDWKAALEALAGELRQFIVFDNLAVYLVDSQTKALEVTYARALGRGRAAEADAAWGDKFAIEVIASGDILHQTPPVVRKPDTGRLGEVHFLGLPLRLGDAVKGAVVFIRFGGPAYSEEHLHVAALVAMWMALLFERRQWLDAYQQLEEVQQRIRLQDDFLATISHELRTPLGFIKGYSTTLLRQDTSWDASTQREFLTIIEEEADSLNRLIEDLLESARLQSNTLQFKFQPVRLDAMIRDVILRIRQRYPGLSVALDFGPVPPIHGDNVHLVRVFENLFGNAIKYAPGSVLTATLRSDETSLRFRLADHGPGIPAEHLPRIFERFYRVPDADGTNLGTGLGLYICKQIILAHRGKIWAESPPGEGAVFFIELPIEAPPPP
jgi:two-component system sensor histidine kinase KdpD